MRRLGNDTGGLTMKKAVFEDISCGKIAVLSSWFN